MAGYVWTREAATHSEDRKTRISPKESRRFTDREIAIVLRKASESEQIATEVGPVSVLDFGPPNTDRGHRTPVQCAPKKHQEVVGMMKMKMVVLGLALLPTAAMAQQTLEFGGRTWVSSSPDAKVEQFMGREALLLRNGGVFLEGVQFQNGVIEYDMATTGHRSFVGAAFRLREAPRTEYEQFYVRPHQTGRFDATQYTPEINGLAAWQLFPEFNAAVDIPSGEWIHVRLVVEGPRLEAYVGDSETPTLVVEHLRLDGSPGLVGLTSNFPEAGALELYPTAFSNVRIVMDEGPAEARAEEGIERAPGTIPAWSLSESHAGLAGALSDLDAAALGAMTWETISTDAMGRINVAEHRSFQPGARGGHVYARVNIQSDRAQTKQLNFGFSDRGLIFLNGSLLFSGNNTYRSRSLRYLGAMTVDNDAIFLPLVEGNNELVFVVSEAFGGWGLVARLADQDGVTVGPGTD